MTKDVNPWELIHDKTISQFVFTYEMILTEMRTHAKADRTIKEWVERLDSERDEFVEAMTKRAVAEPPAEPLKPRYVQEQYSCELCKKTLVVSSRHPFIVTDFHCTCGHVTHLNRPAEPT